MNFLCSQLSPVFFIKTNKTGTADSFETAGSQSYYVYQYEGGHNGIENTMERIRYTKEAFYVLKAMRAFISTDVSMSSQKIPSNHAKRWPIMLVSALCFLNKIATR